MTKVKISRAKVLELAEEFTNNNLLESVEINAEEVLEAVEETPVEAPVEEAAPVTEPEATPETVETPVEAAA
jgi:sulfur carrier protein ThiS